MFRNLKEIGRGLFGPDRFPPRGYFHEIEGYINHTPDFRRLQEYQWQLIFICDELKKGHIYHHLLGNEMERFGVCFTRDKYAMYQKHIGQDTFPIVLDPSFATIHKQSTLVNQRGAPACQILGELYKIRPYQFLKLDKYRLNGIEFIRRRVRLEMPYREVQYCHDRGYAEHLNDGKQNGNIALSTEKIQKLSAWMYVGATDYWQDILGTGSSAYDTQGIFSPVKTFYTRKDAKQYYTFTKPTVKFKDR